MAPPTLAEQVAVEQLAPNEYVSKSLPIRMGNAMPIAYGGCTIAVAVSAACATVPAGFTPYSMLGHFHGPASTTEKQHCFVEHTRTTRSFLTRRVQVKQKQKGGSLRTCLELMADFHVVEPSLVDYCTAPAAAWPKPDDCPTMSQRAEGLRAKGIVSEEQFKELSTKLGANTHLFETRYCLNGVSGQNLSGTAKNVATTQDSLPMTSKVSAEWQRSLVKLESSAANFAALAFLMDGALSFIPMTHGNMWFEDVGACSTLDFALRIFVPEVDMESWTLKERFTSRGGSARSYSEGRLWDDKGQLVASMTQQSILRPKKEDVSGPKM